MKLKLKKLILKKSKSKIVCLTAYSKNFSQILDKYCDVVLVGDSLANVLYGMNDTLTITLEMMINHAQSVIKGIKNSIVVVDMPKDTYSNTYDALKNAKKILKKTRCDAVKIESNNKNFHIIKKLVDSKVAVMGHIGYTPQFKKKFKVHGKTTNDEKKLINEAIKIQNSGAFSIVLECISARTSKKITEKLKIPTIGIGSSINCDGQILVTDDMLGLSGFYPKFVKKYSALNKIIEKAVQKYSKDVNKGSFPTKNNSY
jgi:3-methyl-2-oxobutanoate hydroxymethyltransferase